MDVQLLHEPIDLEEVNDAPCDVAERCGNDPTDDEDDECAEEPGDEVDEARPQPLEGCEEHVAPRGNAVGRHAKCW